MKKSIIALLLGLVFVFSGCNTETPNGSSSNTSLNGSSVEGSVDDSSTSNDDSQNGGSSDDSQNGGSSDGTQTGGCETEHVDENNDEKCDECKLSVVTTFDFLAINDLHGKFEKSDANDGVATLSTYMKSVRNQNENTVFLSSGDMWQGGSASNLTQGLIVTDWMSEMGFASMTLGNHEYDWGSDAVKANEQLANFPFLAINVYDKATNQRVDYCQSSVMVEQNGVKIGIIGAIGDCYSSISPDKVSDVYFKVGSELTSLVKAESETLRAQGADCIVYSIHDGYGSSSSSTTDISDWQLASYYDVSLSNGYVDLVFEGHSHQRYVLKDSYGVYHLQGGGDNKAVAQAKVKINFANENVNVSAASLVYPSEYANSLSPDPIVNTLLEKYDGQISTGSRVVGMNDAVRSSTTILNKVAQLYCEVGEERWGDEYQIVLGGGYLNTRSPYDLHAGEIIYGDLMSILPFNNPLVLCSISGYDLQQNFYNKANYYLGFSEYGNSIKNNLDWTATYYVVVDRYTSLYAPNNLTEIEIYDETTYARDLLADFITAGGWTTPISLTSIPDLLAIGAQLADNEETTTAYYVKGKIKNIASTKYGNMTIEDENGNTLYIYGTYDKDGTTRYDSMTNPPQVGDTVVLCGIIKHYVNTAYGQNMIEMVNGRFYSVN